MCVYFYGHIDASLQISDIQYFQLKKGCHPYKSNNPIMHYALCIMNYALNQVLRFYSSTGRTLRP